MALVPFYTVLVLLIGYPILRATTEIFRGDADRGSFGLLSTSQTLSIPLLLIGLWIYYTRQKRGAAGK